ncbi:unnamed protein product [Chrysoparadoxa australica]
MYSDVNGKWYPLPELYYSVDSNGLVSPHPVSLQEEVEVFFCPHCNFFCVEAEAHTNGGRCPSGCFNCPCCSTVLAAARTHPKSSEPEPHSYCFRCLHCCWSSESIGIVEESEKALIMAATARERQSPGKAQFAKLLLRASKQASAVRHARDISFLPSGKSHLAHVEGAGKQNLTKFTVEDLNNALQVAEAGDRRGPERCGPMALEAAGFEGALLTADWSLAERSLQELSSGPSVRSLGQRLAAPQSESLLQRLPLRTRRGKRCRKDLAMGRAGILVKPRVNPLEGDSSQPRKHGAWFKKDCSAIHSVPNLLVTVAPDAAALCGGGSGLLILRVNNPTESQLRLRLTAFGEEENAEAEPGACRLGCVIPEGEVTLEPLEDELLASGNQERPSLPESLRQGTPPNDQPQALVLHQCKDVAWLALLVSLRDYQGEEAASFRCLLCVEGDGTLGSFPFQIVFSLSQRGQ